MVYPLEAFFSLFDIFLDFSFGRDFFDCPSRAGQSKKT